MIAGPEGGPSSSYSTVRGLSRVSGTGLMEHTRFVGLDIHKERLSISVAESGRSGTVEYLGEIANDPGAISKLCERLRHSGKALAFCYEAGPCGYGVHRQITKLGHRCDVVAPSLIPKKPGDRVKTDRRDATMLARLHRAGELTAVWVPDADHEAMRDLVRLRSVVRQIVTRARQHLQDPMGEVDSDRHSGRVWLQTTDSGDDHASNSRSTRSCERYP